MQSIVKETKQDFYVFLFILIYCLAFALLRFFASPTLELDESQQFFWATHLSWGYPSQPPLYTWLVWLSFKIFSPSLLGLIVVKYFLTFLMFFFFYLTLREFKTPFESFLFMVSLFLIPLYTYEFNRDLSHSILVTTISAISCYVYVKWLRRPSAINYFLLGLFAGLGILSKYNYVFILLALLLASLTTESSRHLILNKKLLVSLLVMVFVVLPHFYWVYVHHLSSIKYALIKGKTESHKVFTFYWFKKILINYLSNIILYLLVFNLIFYKNISKKVKIPKELKPIKKLAIFAFLVPIIFILVFKLGYFNSRWLAPVYLCLPLSLSCYFKPSESKKREKIFICLCILVVILVFVARFIVSFMPDVTGIRERIHIPFKTLSTQLKAILNENHISENEVLLISDKMYFLINLKRYLPKVQICDLKDKRCLTASNKVKILILKAPKNSINKLKVKPLGTLKAYYIHSHKPPLCIFKCFEVQ